LSDGAQISASNISELSGDITLQGVNTLEVNDSLITASTKTGQAGNLIVNASESVRLSGTFNGNPSGLSVQAEGGNAGSMSITTGELAITNGATATVSSTKSGTAGSLDVRARSIALNNNASLSATNESSPVGGDITLQGIDNQQPLETVEVNNSLISASTQSGTAGNLSVNAAESVLLNGTLADGTEGGLAVSATNGGNAGSLSVTTAELTVQNGASATVSSTGTGTAGSLNVNAQTVALNNQARFSAETAGGSGGNIELEGLNTLEVNNSLISASTQSGTAGNLSVNATESVLLKGTLADGTAAGLAVSATNGGNAGSLSMTTGNLTVQNGASATVSSTGKGTAGSLNVNAQTVALNNQARLSAETEAGSGGNISLQGLNTLNVNNSRISASTQNGTAGDVTINASDAVYLRGDGGLYVEATDGGIAGNLRIATGDFIVSNGAQATVSSPEGQAGNLTVTANFMRLNRGKLTAETGGGEGGANILLNISDILWLENESLISANASGAANGGNITINTTFIIALPPEGPEGSDIVANAFQGNGGKVNITAQGILNIQFRPTRTPLNDITASSQFGAAGVVAINTPNVDPSRGLTSLPTDIVDPTGLIDRSCQAGGGEEASAFTVTGRGGLPPNPNEPLGEEGLLDDLGVPVSSGNGQQSGVSTDWLISNSSTPAQIIEAQGWVKQPNGTVILVAQTSSATPQSPRTNPASCQITSHSATTLTASPR
ncbi:MAG TPA: S-layer family protein, partial [Coleofasciculaceae cyanobacterium]